MVIRKFCAVESTTKQLIFFAMLLFMIICWSFFHRIIVNKSHDEKEALIGRGLFTFAMVPYDLNSVVSERAIGRCSRFAHRGRMYYVVWSLPEYGHETSHVSYADNLVHPKGIPPKTFRISNTS